MGSSYHDGPLRRNVQNPTYANERSPGPFERLPHPPRTGHQQCGWGREQEDRVELDPAQRMDSLVPPVGTHGGSVSR